MANANIKGWLTRLTRTLLPRACPSCGVPLEAEAGLCSDCRAALQPRVESSSLLQPEQGAHLVTLGRYTGPLRRTVQALKYAGAREAAVPLAEALGRGVPKEWQVVAVIPVPLHPRRQRERGYNQSALLAEALADALQVPYKPQALTRTRHTQQQAKLSGHARQSNVRGAFAADASELGEGAVLLVDDVLTTGATLRECRDALRTEGVLEIYYAVVAR